MRIVSDIAMRTTCLRRAVGALALDKNGLVIGTGYNGVPCGEKHCNEEHTFQSGPNQPIQVRYPYACSGASALSGTRLDQCAAVHAEMNLLMQVSDVNKIHTIYCTAEPCTHCSKMIANTRCKRVVYEDPYPGAKHFGTVVYEQYRG